MALNTQLADATVNAQADALAALCNSGLIKIYDGTQPATADNATSSNTLGVTLTFGSTAFPGASSGLLTANAITSGTAVAAITPTWARVFKSDGTTVVMDVSAGASGCNLTIGPFTAGTVVSATSFTHDVRNSTSGY
jgi:hypothetical protein